MKIEKRPGGNNYPDKRKINLKEITGFSSLINSSGLNTVCELSGCPNISECFSKKNLTFLLLGKVCTRRCLFCNLRNKSGPLPGLDLNEPARILAFARKMKLKYIILTSVTRDDLTAGGSEIFIKTCRLLKNNIPDIKIELLLPDFRGDMSVIKKILLEEPCIIGHNMETVPRLYFLRNGADYDRSINLLNKIKEYNKNIKTKSSIMLGLGEKEKEVEKVLSDLLSAGCDYVTLGQYYAPGRKNYPVQEYLTEEKLSIYKLLAAEMGFSGFSVGKYVRSSYLSEKIFGGIKN